MRAGGARRARARPLRRGDAPAQRRAGRTPSPGAAMVALQEGVPVRPPRSTARRCGARATSTRARSPGASRSTSPGCRGTRRATARPRPRSRRELRRLWDWLVRDARARPAGRRRASRRDDEPARDGRDRRLPERRQVDADQPADRDARRGRPRDAGRDARPQGARLRVERQASSSSIDTGGVDIADETPITRSIAEQARAGDRGGRPRALRRRRARGITPGRRGDRGDPPQPRTSRCSCSRTRSTTRAATRRARVPPARPRRPGPALRAARPRHRRPARRDRRAAAGRGPRGRCGTRRSASRSSAGRTSASRRS